jgi:hypothetical protein
MELGFRELPAWARLVRDEDDAQRGRSNIRWNVELLLRWMAGGVPPDEYVLSELHERVRTGAALDAQAQDGLLVYRHGVRIFWDALLDAAADDERPTLVAEADVLWSYLEVVVGVFGEAYVDHSEVPESAGERRARTLLERLCARLPVTVEDHERAEHLGFNLSGDFRPFVAALAGASIREHIDLASRLRGRGVLATTEGTRVVGLTGHDFNWLPVLTTPRLLVAYERPTDRTRLATVLDNLRLVVAFAANAGRSGRVAVQDFLPQLLLAQSPEVADEMVRRVFDGLAGTDNADLAGTLRCLAANSFDRQATAAALIVHRNTLLYRVKRIEKLTGLDLQDHHDQEVVYLAQMWTEIRRLI